MDDPLVRLLGRIAKRGGADWPDSDVAQLRAGWRSRPDHSLEGSCHPSGSNADALSARGRALDPSFELETQMIRLSTKINVLVLCGLLFGAPAVHADLLANGSFESGSFVNQGNDTMSLAAGSAVISGWKVITDTTAWIGPTNPFGLSASDGSYFLDLTNYQTGTPFAGLTQVITTSPGATYALSFDLGGSTFWGRPDAITASAAGTSATFTTPLTGTNNDWYRESMQFVATSSSTTIQLQGVTGSQYIGLDNASVDLVSAAPVPEPGTWALMVAGLASLGTVVRRRRGA